MKTFKQLVSEVAEPKSEDEKRFKDKHVVAAHDDPQNGTKAHKATTSKKKRLADPDDGDDEAMYEEKMITCPECGAKFEEGAEHECDEEDDEDEMKEEAMSDAQMKKREEIVKSMKDKKDEFKQRYGDKWKSVMYATATKQAMKESFVEEVLDEAFKAGAMKLKDGSSIKVTSEQATVLNALFKELNSSNKKKMEERLMKDKEGFGEIVAFAKEIL